MRPRFSKTQLYAKEFLKSSHTILPVKSEDLEKMRVPFVIAATPFPSKISAEPLLTPYIYQNALVCSKCHAPAFSSYINCQKDNTWICPLCNHKNNFTQDVPYLNESIQKSSLIYDMPLPMLNLENQEERPPAREIQKKPEFYFLAVEFSPSMVKSGLFEKIISHIKNITQDLKEGKISVYFYNSSLIFPFVHHNSNTKSFTICTIPDVSDGLIPIGKTTFFKLSNEKDQFFKYLDSVSALSPSQSTVSLCSLIKIITPVCRYQDIPLLIITSQTSPGRKEDLYEFGFSNLETSLCITIFSVDSSSPSEPLPVEMKPDMSVLNEISIFLNIHIREFERIELPELPIEIEKQLKSPHFYDPYIIVITSPCLVLRDILGRGFRKNRTSFKMANLSLDDTIYFEFEYADKRINTTSPTVVILVRYLDARGVRFCRCMSWYFQVADNMYSISQETDFSMFLAHAAVKASEDSRVAEIPYENSMTLFVNNGNKVLEDSFAKLFFLGHKTGTARISHAFKHGGNIFSKHINCSIFLGSSPNLINCMINPIAYPLSIMMPIPQNASEIKEKALTNWNGWDALYIRVRPDKALIFLNYGQNLQLWMQAINSDPLKTVISMIRTEENVLFMNPQNEHPLAIRIRELLGYQ